MKTRLIIGLALWLTAGTALAQGSGASGAPSHLRAAEEAYLNVEFEEVRDHALEALRGGGLTPAQLVRTYELLGVANSALHETDTARDYFVRMLGIDPDHELDASVNPEMRDPFLEARGLWAARAGRLRIEVGLDRPNSALRVQVIDPTDMATRIRVAARLEGDAEFVTQEYEATVELTAAVTGAGSADRVEYYVEILDMHGNVMLGEGSAFDPRVVGRMRVEGGGGGGVTIFEEPVFWIIVAAVAAVAVGVTVGVVVDQRSRIGIQTGISFGVD
ncbi:MAG: hypothetical protein H6719_22565 [Sandaracinaceae bacterium]|nr:hypothetical protein [Sandaracinaceae bacterium]